MEKIKAFIENEVNLNTLKEKTIKSERIIEEEDLNDKVSNFLNKTVFSSSMSAFYFSFWFFIFNDPFIVNNLFSIVSIAFFTLNTAFIILFFDNKRNALLYFVPFFVFILLSVFYDVNIPFMQYFSAAIFIFLPLLFFGISLMKILLVFSCNIKIFGVISLAMIKNNCFENRNNEIINSEQVKINQFNDEIKERKLNQELLKPSLLTDRDAIIFFSNIKRQKDHELFNIANRFLNDVKRNNAILDESRNLMTHVKRKNTTITV